MLLPLRHSPVTACCHKGTMHWVELNIIDRVDVIVLPVALECEVLGVAHGLLDMLHCYTPFNGSYEVARLVCSMQGHTDVSCGDRVILPEAGSSSSCRRMTASAIKAAGQGSDVRGLLLFRDPGHAICRVCTILSCSQLAQYP